MTWNRVKQEWKKTLLFIARPSSILSAIAWLILQVAGYAESGPLRVALLGLSALPAVIFGKNLK